MKKKSVAKRLIKSRRIRWAGIVARLAERRAYRVLVVEPVKDCVKDLGIDARILPKWIFMKLVDRVWPELTCFRLETSGRLL